MTDRVLSPDVAELAHRLGLVPMPREGGLHAQTWRGPSDSGRPLGTAIVVLLDDAAGHHSAPHRLPITELWHFHQGDPMQMLLLGPDGSVDRPVLGPVTGPGADVSHRVQVVVPAGHWMTARVLRPGGWTLFGCTMTPGFLWEDYEPADLLQLSAAYPGAAAELPWFSGDSTAD